MDALEGDAFEVLRLVRSIKNSFAPISRIPPEVLSLIPDYYCDRDGGGDEGDGDGMDRDLVALTHVCHGWRDTFASRSSLWTRLSFTNVDKTRTYIQRSQSAPLKLYLEDHTVIDDAFELVIPHLGRLKSLAINTEVFPSVLKHFRCHAPLLEYLDIYTSRPAGPILDRALFNGDLLSLRELHLYGVITDFPWKNFANLRVVDIRSSSHGYGTAGLLDFLESAPLLHTITLDFRPLDSPDVPPERIVPLRHLKFFFIQTRSPLVLLYHLHIPAGASLKSRFHFDSDEPPLRDYLPERSPNFSNLSHITTINLTFNRKKEYARFSGPSGSLHLLPTSGSRYVSLSVPLLRFFDPPILSTIQRLTVSGYANPGTECAVSQTLSSANHLRILILIDCDDQLFTRALDPGQNPSNPVLCPGMEEVILYLRHCSLHGSYFKSLVTMAKNRASRGVSLPSITIVSRDGLPPERWVSGLRKYVTHVVCKIDERRPPAWDHVPGEGGGSGWV